jgi:hypothetical protein
VIFIEARRSRRISPSCRSYFGCVPAREKRDVTSSGTGVRVAYHLLAIFRLLGINVRHIAFSTIEMMIDANC